MKIIKAGDPKRGKWWLGRKVECVCGRVVELEETDASRNDVSVLADVLIVQCANCAKENHVHRIAP